MLSLETVDDSQEQEDQGAQGNTAGIWLGDHEDSEPSAQNPIRTICVFEATNTDKPARVALRSGTQGLDESIEEEDGDQGDSSWQPSNAINQGGLEGEEEDFQKRRARNIISAISHEGSTISDPPSIQRTGVDFFRNLLSPEPSLTPSSLLEPLIPHLITDA
ncbi:hypothetical protein Salat_1701600 [Sesamum alatum]|uniref:Uncharacterized protein n=1 Tax=Sesamum alatum TaxID=300844 RepID=A0AAE1Y7F8_9LAMI|nr:hypothetical protein Salat_1701600 [Sesamum alatum]